MMSPDSCDMLLRCYHAQFNVPLMLNASTLKAMRSELLDVDRLLADGVIAQYPELRAARAPPRVTNWADPFEPQ